MVLKLIACLWILVLVPFAGQAQERQQISEDLYYTPLLDSVYMITHIFPRFGSNSLFVVLPGNQGILIDTPNETYGTSSLLEWIHTSFVDLQLTAINTGWHYDNMGGNEYLLSQDIPVYGPGITANLIIDRGDELKEIILEQTASQEDARYYESYKALNFLPPDHIFAIEEGLNMELGDEASTSRFY